jgi:hypothetical protein
MWHAMVRTAALLAMGIAICGSAAAQRKVTVPAGTRLLVRMVDGVDSSKQKVGYRFTANLETNLQVGDTVVARGGATVYGRLENAKSAGNMKGGAELTLGAD